MSREKELVKNTGILSLGAFVPKLIAIIVTPILTSQLTKTEFGIYDLIVTIVSLLMPAVTLEITSAAFRFLIDKKNNIDDSREIISTLYAFVAIMAVIASSVFLIIVGNRLGNNKILIFLYFLFDILLITTEQIMRGLGKTILYSLSYIVRSSTNLILILILLGVIGKNNYGLDGLLVSMTASTGVALVTVFCVGKTYNYIRLNSVRRSTLVGMLKYSWPMVPNNLSGWVLRLSDRLVITSALGIEMNAVYAAANKLPTLFQIFQSTFTLAWQENASLAVNDNDNDKSNYYSQMINMISDMLIGVMGALLAVTPLLFKLLIRGDYGEAYYQLPVLYGAMIFSCLSSVLGGIYIAYKKTANVGISTTIAALINLTIDILFVNVIGIWAGSVSTLVSYIVLLVYRGINIQKFQEVRFNVRRFIIGLILVIISSILFLLNVSWANIVNVILACIIVTFFDRKVIAMFFKMIKQRLSKQK